jgi:hypothetical protein
MSCKHESENEPQRTHDREAEDSEQGRCERDVPEYSRDEESDSDFVEVLTPAPDASWLRTDEERHEDVQEDGTHESQVE